jgi:hypothetical protein
MQSNDLPEGYRWATEDETQHHTSYFFGRWVERTTDSDGNAYPPGTAYDFALPLSVEDRTDPKLETFVFHWSREHGDCYDCSRPAAFLGGLRVKYCAICAANAAAEGEPISWIASDIELDTPD